jgi:hypothetical protein
MGWSIGWDQNWQRDIGYRVPAYCDHSGCAAEINRGLAYVCGGEPFGGDGGCGLFFCDEHRAIIGLCERCEAGEEPFQPTADHPRWIHHKQTDPSWEKWRRDQRSEAE